LHLKLLVTGGTGYIGSYLVHRLSQDERVERIYVLSRSYKDFLNQYGDRMEHVRQDVKDLEGLKAQVERLEPDVVLHLAALIKGNYLEFIGTNVVGTMHMLEAVKDMSIRLFVFASTAANLYGNAIYRPIDEKHPLNPISLYGLSTQLAEDAVKFYALRYEVPAVIFRQTNVYGWAPVMKYALVNALIRSALEEGVLKVFGSGRQQRNLIHISDLARYYEAAIFHQKPEVLRGEVLNVAGPQTTTVMEVAELLRDLLRDKYGLKVEIRHEPRPDRKFEVYDFPISYEKAKKLLGVEARICLRTGLEMELERALKGHGSRKTINYKWLSSET